MKKATAVQTVMPAEKGAAISEPIASTKNRSSMSVTIVHSVF